MNIYISVTFIIRIFVFFHFIWRHVNQYEKHYLLWEKYSPRPGTASREDSWEYHSLFQKIFARLYFL